MRSQDPEHTEAKRRTKSTAAVTVNVNGPRLQQLRRDAGLTQEELAKKADYSDRLIRKAEASGLLKKSTIAHLAAALSTRDHKVTAEDLIFSREASSVELFSALLIGTPVLTDSMIALLHPQLQLSVAGQELAIPFAGDYVGHTAIQSFRTRFAERLSIAAEFATGHRIYTADSETCVQCSVSMHHNSSTEPVQVWWFLKVQFENNIIRSLELMYDTGVICRLLERIDS
ncbi:MAG TPA: helix-turn-helix transcriptional regulator [Planctomycetaceae bacterium]|nr:helix-turn-helix transcriptional regulator [Planctomycetaceae bacterium]